MKNTLVLSLCVGIMSAVAMPLRAATVTATIDGVVYNLDTATSFAQVGDNSHSTLTTITIPATVSYNGVTYTVTSIMEGTATESIRLFESQLTISSAFGGGSGSLRLSDKINGIEGFTITATNTTLQKLIIKAPIAKIPEGMVAACTSLTEVELPSTVTEIEKYAFAYAEKMAIIRTGADGANGVLPKGLTTLGVRVFCNCWALTTMTFPVGITTIPEYTFYHCHPTKSNQYTGFNLRSVRMLGPVTTIGDAAFQRCYSLTDITLPATLQTIGEYAFAGLPASGTCYLPDITKISKYGLADTNFDYIHFGKNLTELADCALKNTMHKTTLKTLVVDATTPPTVTAVKEITKDFFHGTFYGLTPANIKLYVPQESVAAYKAKDVWKDFDIQGFSDEADGIVYIYDDVHKTCIVGDNSGCTKTHIIIPETVQHLGITWHVVGIMEGTTTMDTQALTAQVTSAFGGGTAAVSDGSADPTHLQVMPRNTTLQTLTIQAPITRLPRNMVADCVNLTTVTLEKPQLITELGAECLAMCPKITAFAIPSNVTKIEEGAFAGSTGITELTFPEGVTEIPPMVCYHYNTDADAQNPYTSSKLQKVVFQGDVTSIGAMAFQRCYSLSDITIPQSVQSIGDYAFAGLPATGTLELPDIQTVGAHALADVCFSEIHFGSKLTSLGEQALKDSFRFRLKKLVVDVPNPASITMGANVFYIKTNGEAEEERLQRLKKITLMVPDGKPEGSEQTSLYLYQHAPQWQDFYVASDEYLTGIEETEAEAATQPADIYNLAGQRVAIAAAQSELQSLPAGIYILKQGTTSRKVVVK